MTANVITMAGREIRERLALLGVAAALGAVTLVAHEVAHLDAGTLGASAFLVALAIGAYVGLGLFGGGIAWYFSRPLSGAAIWAGKLGGAVLLAIAAAAVMALPVLVAGSESLASASPLGAAGLAILPIMLVAAGAVGGIIARARGRWLLVDLLCCATLSYLPNHSAHLESIAPRHGDVVGPAIIGSYTLAFLVASAAGVIAGRADPRRAHAAASICLWSIVLSTQVAIFIYAASL
jgi:hypothetical protein